MKLRKRFFGVIGGLAVMAGGVSADEPRQIAAPVAGPISSSNQKIANEIALAIARAVPGQGYNVSVEYQGGTATLRGMASSPTMVHQILKAARGASRASHVVNEISVGAVNPVQPTMYQGPAPQAQSMPAMPDGAGQNLTPAAPEYTFPQGAAPQYDMPFMPPFAWPATAPYPNYSTVQYPLRYSAGEWPYIGPFHPYPEPPLDWREVKMTNRSWMRPVASDTDPPLDWQCVKLKWDDGHWYLQFSDPWWAGLQRWYSRRAYAEDTYSCGCDPCSNRCGAGEGESNGFRLKFKEPICTQVYAR